MKTPEIYEQPRLWCVLTRYYAYAAGWLKGVNVKGKTMSVNICLNRIKPNSYIFAIFFIYKQHFTFVLTV